MLRRTVFGPVRCLVVGGTLLLTTTATSGQTVIHVRATAPPGGRGATWATAYRSLQDAITAASAIPQPPDVQIWVARGTYKADESEASPGGTGNRNATFMLHEGVSWYGHFFGQETSILQRDLANLANATVLDGDLAGDDRPGFTNYGDNTHAIVTGTLLTADVLVDGFTIRGANADIVNSGGIRMIGDATSPFVKLKLHNTTVKENASLGGASGVYIDLYGADVINCLIQDNENMGLRTKSCTPTAAGFFFMSSTTVSHNGSHGVWLCRSACVTVEDSVFVGNAGGNGFTLEQGSGGVANSFIRSRFLGNFGGLVAQGLDVTVSFCEFSGNISFGASINSPQPLIQSNTFFANGTGADSLVVVTFASGFLKNCIFWDPFTGNQNDHVTGLGNLSVIIFNDMPDGCMMGCINADPLFIPSGGKGVPNGAGDDGIIGTLDDDLRLQPRSPCIGTGENGTDMGANLFEDIVLGMSAWDWELATGHFVNPNAWTAGIPSDFDVAFFDNTLANKPLPSLYRVVFPFGAVQRSNRLFVRTDIVEFELSEADYEIIGDDTIDQPSVVIGEYGPMVDTRLTVNNVGLSDHGLVASRVSIADAVQSNATLTVFGPASTLFATNDLWIGREGDGELILDAGSGSLTGTNLVVGDRAGAAGFWELTNGAGFSYQGFGKAARTSVIIGNAASVAGLRIGSGATLTGGAFTGDVVIARQTDSAGVVTVDGGAWVAPSTGFIVGESGDAFVEIRCGGVLTTTTIGPIVLAQNQGATATLIVTGLGSTWEETTLSNIDVGSLGTATIEVSDGGTIDASLLGLQPGSKIQGDGVIIVNAGLINIGVISPGVTGLAEPGGLATGVVTGQLTIQGDYRQVGTGIGSQNERSGTVVVRAGDVGTGFENDHLLVTGEAELAGGLVVELLEGALQPDLNDSFTVLTAGPIVSQFDVAFMPGLQAGKFMRVEYGAGAPLTGPVGGVSVVVDTLAGLFGFENPVSQTIGGTPSGVALGDFDPANANGIDLAIPIRGATPADPGSVLVLINDGTGQGFSQVQQITVGLEPSDITVGRLNGGIDLDIAVTNSASNTVSVLLNSGLGDGTFNLPVDFATGNQPSALVAADFNEDGFTDLAVANEADNTVQIFSNDGTPAIPGFLAGPPIGVGGAPLALEVEDLDDNKDLDMVVANRDTNNISIMMGLGNGTFNAPINLSVGAAPVDLATGANLAVSDFARQLPDLDGNGRQDIVTTNNGDGTVSVILNNSAPGVPAFTPAVNLPVGDLPRSLTAIDLEGDGDSDLAIVANNDLGNAIVQVLRNDTVVAGQLIFADADELDVGPDPAFVIASDMDGDDDEDLITVNESVAPPPASSGPSPIGPPGPQGSFNVRINSPCPDTNGDGVVNVLDLIELLLCFGQPAVPACQLEDVNDDGTVNVLDLIDLLLAFGTTCP